MYLKAPFKILSRSDLERGQSIRGKKGLAQGKSDYFLYRNVIRKLVLNIPM